MERTIAEFYRRLRADALLGPNFASLPDGPAHERRVADFWWIAMGGKPPEYEVAVDMVGVHARLNLRAAHFTRWLELLRQTLDAELPPDQSADWLRMAEGIAARLATALAR